jgi:hypothetical protein
MTRENSLVTQPAAAQSVGEKVEIVRNFLTLDYLSVIRQFPDKNVQDMLMRESVVTLVRTGNPSKEPPGAPVSDQLPDDLRFLQGSLVDLGFGKLNLPQTEIERIFSAFCGEGVAVPGTHYKLRHSVMSLFTLVEPATGHEVTLPTDWRQVVRSQSWIGKEVVPPGTDLSLYRNVGDGYFSREEGKCD